LVNLVLIDGTGAAPVPDAIVLVNDGIIRAAGAAAKTTIPAGYVKVDLHGAYLLPGFINAHVHSAFNESNLKLWLSSGVTTVRDLGYLDVPGLVSKKNLLSSDPTHARIVAATPIITRKGGYGTVFIDGPEAARAAVKRFVKSGVDLIKIAIEDDLQGRRWQTLSAAEITAVVDAAHAAGMRVSAHVTHERNLSRAIDAGVDDIAHMVVEPITEDEARAVVAGGILWIPTLELWKGVSEDYSLDWRDVAVRNTGIFFKAGGKVALGTDYNGYEMEFDDGFPLTEAKLLLEAGMSPMDVIVAGTRNAAEACGRAAEIGTIAKGQTADLLAVARDPLADISALAEPVQVFKAGRAVLPEKPEVSHRQDSALSADMIASFDKEIPKLMKEQHVPGLAVAVTDRNGTIWCKGYGTTGFRGGQPVNGDTLFSLLPITGALTSTAIMMACGQGLVDLDAPIVSYVPGFSVNSLFEPHPERTITLRHLLSHTAGFAQEAPYGNNFDSNESDFGSHIQSIEGTWLRFPVGANSAYSNLGIDVAAYVLQQRLSRPLPTCMRDILFAPLGMTRTTMDGESILADPNRAAGHAPFYRQVPALTAMAGAGGAYSSAEDMARFIRFHLDGGRVGGKTLLDRKWRDAMYSIPASGVTGGGGLDIFKNLITLAGHNRTYGYGIGGGGFGFSAAVNWYPTLGIGGVVLADSAGGSIAFDVLFKVLNGAIDDPRMPFHKSLAALPPDDPETRIPQGDPAAQLSRDNSARLSRLRMPVTPESAAALRAFVGDYKYRVWGRAMGSIKIRLSGDALALDGQTLYPVAAGLFFTPDGEALDFRGPVPTWRNIELARIGIPPWQWILICCGLLAFSSSLVAAGPIAIARRARGWEAAGCKPLSWTAFTGAGIVALLIGLLAFALCQYPFLIGDGTPAWTPGIPFAQGAVILAPYLLLLFSCVMAGCAVASWRGRYWSTPGRTGYTIMAAGAVLAAVMVVIWGLIAF
jgi:CubicO group peptidase (beta-lactamase class C family)